jgi:hypothetical protein
MIEPPAYEAGSEEQKVLLGWSRTLSTMLSDGAASLD